MIYTPETTLYAWALTCELSNGEVLASTFLVQGETFLTVEENDSTRNISDWAPLDSAALQTDDLVGRGWSLTKEFRSFTVTLETAHKIADGDVDAIINTLAEQGLTDG